MPRAFPARVDSEGTLFLLRDQDRRKWDRAMIAEGMRALDRAVGRRSRSPPFTSRPASPPATRPRHPGTSTDWPQIVELYDDLLALTGSPVVAMNRAIAVSRIDGALAGLAALDAIDDLDALDRYPLLPAIQAELWREAGDIGPRGRSAIAPPWASRDRRRSNAG